MKTLIATDGSAGSFEAIRQISRILSPGRDEAVLYYSPPPVETTHLDIKTVELGQSALAEAIFSESISQFPAAWQSTVKKLIGSADPRADIVESALECGANVIVVGARGLGAVASAILGSVSRSVVHSATIPVLVAHSNQRSVDATGMRVLVACESAETGRRLTDFLGQFSWPQQSSCRVLNVAPSVLGGTIPSWLAAPRRSAEVQELIRCWVEEEKSQLADARKAMEAVCRSLSAAFGDSSASVVQGHTAWAILDAAQTQPCDLIVIGAKSSTPLGRLFVGSTCETVLNRASCSVLVIRHD
jgi:nucleotide-binding universal stress UspA family protein